MVTDLFDETLAYIEAQIGQEQETGALGVKTLGVKALARLSGYSVYHFCHLFRQATGMSPMKYVRMRKLHHAAMALADARASRKPHILDVALRFGFKSQEGFTRAFKRAYGVTPALYGRVHRVTSAIRGLRARGVALHRG